MAMRGAESRFLESEQPEDFESRRVVSPTEILYHAISFFGALCTNITHPSRSPAKGFGPFIGLLNR